MDDITQGARIRDAKNIKIARDKEVGKERDNKTNASIEDTAIVGKKIRSI